jgi:hypothetical protein
VPGHSLVVSEAREQAKRGGQAFLAMAPLFGNGTENWGLRNILGSSWGFRHWVFPPSLVESFLHSISAR